MTLFATWLSLHQSAPYVVAAYLVLFAVVLIYVGIMVLKLLRNQRELQELRAEFEAKQRAEREAREQTDAQRRASEPVA
jgi:NADH:ubiquinone oxidoreductase subunit 3 (subunit A)